MQLYCWENIDVGQSWDSQGCVCLFIMEERIIASVAFSNFNRLVIFFFKTLWIPRPFFSEGVEVGGGSLVPLLSWFLLH